MAASSCGKRLSVHGDNKACIAETRARKAGDGDRIIHPGALSTDVGGLGVYNKGRLG